MTDIQINPSKPITDENETIEKLLASIDALQIGITLCTVFIVNTILTPPSCSSWPSRVASMALKSSMVQIGTSMHILVCGLPAEGGDSVTVNGN